MSDIKAIFMVFTRQLGGQAGAPDTAAIDLAPEMAIDLVAQNKLLRSALASAEGADATHNLLTSELQHRIGNLLAVVLAIARQSFHAADAASLHAFSARLQALSTAQKLLIKSETRAATLTEVVAETLAPFGLANDRVRQSGPYIALDGRRAHALTLAVHELATNATKYGALSNDSGWVEVTWSCDDNQLEFVWREHDGPPVTQPARKGFGTILVTRNLATAFGGSIDTDFNPSGYTCRLRAILVGAALPGADA